MMRNIMFKLSKKSLDKLVGVDPKLVRIVKRAIELSKIDFGISEGVRSVETQRKYVAAGKSQTMASKHIEGRAADLIAYVDGNVSWELNLYDDLADAMKKAAIEQEGREDPGKHTFRDDPNQPHELDMFGCYQLCRARMSRSCFITWLSFPLQSAMPKASCTS